MLRWRLLTAAILIPAVCIILLLLDTFWVAASLGLILILSGVEWSKLNRMSPFATFSFLLSLLLLMLLGYLSDHLPISSHRHSQATQAVIYLAAAGWFMASLAVAAYPKKLSCVKKRATWRSFLVGVWLLWPMWLSLVKIHAEPQGGRWVLLLCLIVWGADTGAYFIGRFLGRHPLAPRISPKKTLEGFVAAFLFGLIAFWFAIALCELPVDSPVAWSLSVLILVFASVLGDLFESMIKRQQGAKDSGSLLPGHGGLLDRIDSLTAAAPLFWIAFYWLNGSAV